MKRGTIYTCFTAFIFTVLLTLPAIPIYAAPVLITDIQYWLAPDHIQTIISFNSAIQSSYHHRSNPPRFVLEIPNCENMYGDQKIPVNDIILQRIRVQRLSNGTTQIVFDLTEKIEATVQTLSRFNGQPDRIVVNLFDRKREEQSQQQRVEMTQMTTRLKQNEYFIVVLDPGHGGRDPGAISRSGLKEKDIVLDIAKRMQKLIQANAPYVKVFLTRDSDYFLPLPRRTEIAEEYKADLFISLHVNANPNRKVRGFSVYTLSENATDEAARQLAEKENAADLLFGGIVTPIPKNDSLLTFVLADLSKTAWLQHSLEFGQITVNTTVTNLRDYKVYKEGLKRANFVVLRTAAMPAVLVEACYMSNKKEEALLNRADFRMNIAQSLAKSVVQYFAQRQHSMRPQIVHLKKETASIASVHDTKTHNTDRYKVHIVKSGESLSVIAGKYNVKLVQLRQVNKLASADLIYVGQRLWIP
jgi:N-acetylmuramoyl-L-alanine amidase